MSGVPGLDEDELYILMVAVITAIVTTWKSLGWSIHRMFRRGNAAAGLPVLTLLVGLAWIVFVLRAYADPSVVGVYRFFYAIVGVAAISGLGFLVPQAYGLRLGVDVYQRSNMAVALVVCGFALATAMIYGGANWGDADPVGDGEGGWWIPLGFFLAGWVVLVIAALIYIGGEPTSLRLRLVQDRSVADGRAAASYLLGVAVVLTEAVAGDFWGWTEGLLGLLGIAGMMATHAVCVRRLPVLVTTVESQAAGRIDVRRFESIAYGLLALLFWILQRMLDVWTAGVGR